MKFLETLKKGLVLMPISETVVHKAHDTDVTLVIEAKTPLVVWGYTEFSEEHDHLCGMEVEFLYNADIWAFPVPRGEDWGTYFVPVTD